MQMAFRARRNKMRYKAIAILTGAALLAVPAAAEQSGKARPATPEKTYCLQYSQDTGSRISRTECRTKKEWARIGVDIDELMRK
jgi:hypothetical protein